MRRHAVGPRRPGQHRALQPDLQPKVEYKEVVRQRSASPARRRRDVGPRREDRQTRARKDRRTRSGHEIDKPQINEATGRQEDPLGLISRWFPGLAAKLRQPGNWLSIIGVIGLLLAFGHSILAMSGEETLAQVYREVESPKMKNFKKAAFIVFVYSLVLTASISFLAVLLIPDEVRMKTLQDNLIGGLAMYMPGPLVGPAGC